MAHYAKPIPLALRHRRDWSRRRLGRYCVCGLRWRCPDRLVRVPVEGLTPTRRRTRPVAHEPRWAGPRFLLRFGSATVLTPGRTRQTEQVLG